MNNNKDTNNCKLVLYRKFLQCGEGTWQKVLNALEESGHPNLAEEVNTKLLMEFGKQHIL